MRYWYVSSFVLMAFVLQVLLLAGVRAEEDPGLTNSKTLNAAPTPSDGADEAFAPASIEHRETAADAGPATAGKADTAAAEMAAAEDPAGEIVAAEGAPDADAAAGNETVGKAAVGNEAVDVAAVAGAHVDNPFAHFDLFSLVTGKASGTGGEEPRETRAEPDYSRWRSLYQSIEELPEEQKRKASAIVTDSLPRLNELDTKISGTVGELRALTYSDNADPEELPRLGLDLQRLREELKATLAVVNIRLQKEAGLRLSDPVGRGCESIRVYPAGAIKSVNLPR